MNFSSSLPIESNENHILSFSNSAKILLSIRNCCAYAIISGH